MLDAGLYIVATPIGNLSDLTTRAADTLRAADRIACEDTRTSKRLLDGIGVDAPLVPYHDHNGEAMRPKILAWLEAGERVALISDAGTPLISDPGYKLVSEVAEAGHRVIPIPGASALTAALSVAGLPTDRFTFLGFPPQKSAARKSWFKAVVDRSETLVCYESTKRLGASLADALDVFGDRQAVIGRELTKRFEEVRRDKLSDLVAHYNEAGAPKGECVLLIEGEKSDGLGGDGPQLAVFYRAIIDEMPIKAAAKLAAKLYGGQVRDHYARLQDLKDGS